jgi:ATP:corrinoid adenosyltransferase
VRLSARRISFTLKLGLDHWVRRARRATTTGARPRGASRARDIVVGGAFGLVILDELLGLYFELVPLADVLRLFQEKPGTSSWW